jgi:phospholipase C
MWVAAGVAALALVTAAGGRSGERPCGTAVRPPARWSHVVWIWMENESYDEIVGNPSARYLNQLAAKCGLATNYFAITHPSLPNYLAATSGSDWGIADDNPPAAHALAHPSIFSQVAAAGMTWRSYDESMPARCALSSSGQYAVKHNPAAYYTGIRRACTRWDVPLSDLRLDSLPSFAFVTPNVCDDMHDCSVSTGDVWLKRWVTRIVAGSAYSSGTTALFVTFDEGSGSSNRVATVVVSPTTPPGTRARAWFDHYSLLKTTEQLLGISTYLAHADDRSTRSMRPAFHL